MYNTCEFNVHAVWIQRRHRLNPHQQFPVGAMCWKIKQLQWGWQKGAVWTEEDLISAVPYMTLSRLTLTRRSPRLLETWSGQVSPSRRDAEMLDQSGKAAGMIRAERCEPGTELDPCLRMMSPEPGDQHLNPLCGTCLLHPRMHNMGQRAVILKTGDTGGGTARGMSEGPVLLPPTTPLDHQGYRKSDTVWLNCSKVLSLCTDPSSPQPPQSGMGLAQAFQQL
ncbi:uncharacterized protein LOC115482054 [Microcaecilia unicolor]|uniref:Uncharacterized protein LOC115482054 n=1 Tax=Microcaecilia unicolor TaxID=1415580 RepID=A0A6P7ZVY6_9AMPH|nr:uncharacterized protein LOC115482054 [Microcaecilia unicolor]